MQVWSSRLLSLFSASMPPACMGEQLFSQGPQWGQGIKAGCFLGCFPSLLLSLMLHFGIGVEPSLFGTCHQVQAQLLKFLLDFLPQTLQLHTFSSTEGLQLKSEWKAGIQLPLPATESSVWKLWRKAPETHFDSKHNSSFPPMSLFGGALNSYHWFLCPRVDHYSTTGLFLLD